MYYVSLLIATTEVKNINDNNLKSFVMLIILFLSIVGMAHAQHLTTDMASVQANASINSHTNRPFLRVGYDEQPPFQYTDAEGQVVGINIARMRAILEEADVPFRFYPYPWKRIVHLIESGDLDVGMGASRLPDREKFALFSNEIFTHGSNALFVKNKYVDLFENFESLSMLQNLSIKIAIRRGASYSDEYEALLAEPAFQEKIVPITNTGQAIKLAISNRVQGFISPPEIAAFEFNKACVAGKFTEVYDLLAKESPAAYLMYSKLTVSAERVQQIDIAMRKVDSASSKYNTYSMPENPACPNF
jgi:polar amino acid transport system substrate-binding protein